MRNLQPVFTKEGQKAMDTADEINFAGIFLPEALSSPRGGTVALRDRNDGGGVCFPKRGPSRD